MSRFTVEQWSRIKEVLDQAIERPAEKRAEFVGSACGDDQLIFREVRSLLAAYERSCDTNSLDSPFSADINPSESPSIDSLVGPWKIIREIGRGGMGSVYLAERADGRFEKQVAIKLVRRGFDREGLRRFRAEQQILARLEHPNIARLLDGGTTDDGRPYFVMEYVDGSPLLEDCRNRNLNTDERLQLFRTICDAVGFAHRNLIVHRDLKPSNILVDHEGRIKLLDFGIAKLIDEDGLGGEAPLTRTGMRVMTPEYASPEQVRGEPVTTVSDVYNLGIVLYELLSGCRPYRVSDSSPSAVEELVCRQMPPKPSTVVAEGNSVVASGEGFEKLRRRLAGDLDTIVMTALRKEAERRYSSVDKMGDDIRRHQEGMPVLARPDTLVYRVSKFVTRHKVGVAAVAALIVTIGVGVASTLHQAGESKRRFEEVRSLSNALIFEFHDAIRDVPGTTVARRALVDHALENLTALSQDAKRDPTLRSELAEAFERVGEIQGDPRYANLGDLSGATTSYRRALELREELFAGSPDNDLARAALAESYGRLAVVTNFGGASQESIEYSRRAIELYAPLLEMTPGDDGLAQQAARVRSELGWWLVWEGDFEHGFENIRDARTVLEGILERQPENLDAGIDLWWCYNYEIDGFKLGDDSHGARTLLETALKLLLKLEGLDARHPRIQSALVSCHWQMGENLEIEDPERALESYREVLRISKELVAADNADRTAESRLARGYHSIGNLLVAMKRSHEAIEPLGEAHKIRKALLDQNSSSTALRNSLANTNISLCEAYTSIGRFNRAVEYGENAVRLHERAGDGRHENPGEQANLAVACMVVARVHRAMAEATVGGAPSFDHWRNAQRWFDRAHAIFTELEDAGMLHEFFRSEFEAVEAERIEIAGKLAAAGN